MDNKNLAFLPDSWTPEEKTMSLWFTGSLGFMLLFMFISLLPGFIGGFSIFMAIISALSIIGSVIVIMVYELGGKKW